jgi:hypothetical protein
MHHWRTAAALAFCLTSIAACGGKTAAPPPVSAKATSRAPAVSPELISYAQQAQPSLKTSLDTVNALISELGSSHDYEKIAFDCADKASTFSGDNIAFQNIGPPPQAQSAATDAINGYKIALLASNECSTAADARLPGDLATAAGDFSRASSDMTRAETSIAAWAASH